MTFWAVIPAGGSGTRLWPLSRPDAPKFLLDLTGEGRTLIQQTRDRLAPLAGEHVLVITGAAHVAAVARQLPEVPVEAIIAEPGPRDSMAAIGLAAAILEREGGDVVMGSFAADHAIADPEAFRAVVATAVEAARDGWLVTIGIEPTFPSTAYGYVRLGDAVREGVWKAREFVEKPDAATAAAYVAGGYRWNAGMFVARPATILDLLADHDPEFTATLREIAADPGLLAERWPTLPKVAIDRAVAEPAAAAGRVAVVPGSFDWRDVGDFDAVASALEEREYHDVVVLGDESRVHSKESTGIVVTGTGRSITLLGVDDVVVVDTEDELLVTTRARAQEVGKLAR